jgi:hypothetical protein
MKERTSWLLVLATLIGLAIGVVLSCGGNSGGGGGDDDNGADDDDSAATDDDAADDDTSGDLIDNGDGTATDPSSGLTWQVTPATIVLNWTDAMTYCQNLTLAGGGWHLPTISELRSLIRGCPAIQTGGACGVTDFCLDWACRNDYCEGCGSLGGPGSGGAYWPAEMSGEIGQYWSSSLVANQGVPSYAWGVSFYYGGDLGGYGCDGNRDARCVR